MEGVQQRCPCRQASAVEGNSLVLSCAANDDEKLGGILVYLESTIIRWLKGSSHCISTYKEVSILGQVHANVGLGVGYGTADGCT